MVRSPCVPNPGNSAPLRLHHPGMAITALAEPRRRSVHLPRVEFPLACSAFQDRIAYLSSYAPIRVQPWVQEARSGAGGTTWLIVPLLTS